MPASTVKDWSAGSFSGARHENQDYVVFTQSGDFADIDLKGVLLVVCDGSESQTCGPRASRIASLKVMDAYYRSKQSEHPDALLSAVSQAAMLV